MKIRNGFVSNSSSTSFCMYGMFEDTEIGAKKLFNGILNLIKNGTITEKQMIDVFGTTKFKEFDGYWDDCLPPLLEKLDCDFISIAFANSYLYIGRDPSTIKDDETGKQFKDKTEEVLKRIYNVNKVDCNWLLEVDENH